MACHTSQFFEWLPYNGRYADEMPEDHNERLVWFSERMRNRFAQDTDLYRGALIERYGAEHGSKIQWCEAFELCEYGSPLDEEMKTKLFPLQQPHLVFDTRK